MKTTGVSAFALILLSIQLFAQQTEFVRPSEILAQADIYIDSGRYADAISLLQKISERDTAYAVARLKMTYAFIDSDKPDSAIQICRRALLERTPERSEYLRLEGMAVSKNDFKKGAALLEDAIKQYPTMANLRYSLAAICFDNKQYEKSMEHCFKTLEINPYYSSAHKILSKIAMLQGHKVQAMMAMGIYLGIAPSDNAALVLLNQLADNQVTDEGSYPAFSPNSATRLDQMIRAKIVMSEEFKSAFGISAPVVRQFELIFDQLNTLSASAGDQYFNYYLPLYRLIKDNSHIEPFIYHLLTSTDIEEAKKWRKKNEKVLTQFYDATNTGLKQPRANVAFPDLGVPEKTNTWYDNSNRVSAIGKSESEKRVGQWLFLHQNGEKSAQGTYNNAGVKIGVWKYFYDNGQKKSIEDMQTGEVTLYSEAGYKTEHFFLKEGKIEGNAETFYHNGDRRKVISYVNGKPHGKQTDYFPGGAIAAVYHNTEGITNGLYESFHPNGKLKIRCTFKEDYYEGKYEEYYINGKLKSVGEYSSGKSIGEWKFYHRNGKLSYTGAYNTKGKANGEWTYYDHIGLLTEKRKFDEEGRYDGENLEYEDNKLKYSWEYKKGLLIKHTSFDADGKVIFSAGNNNGTFYAKIYDMDRRLRREGSYKQGKGDGTWRYYNRYGVVVRESTFREDELHGKNTNYFATGKKQSEVNFENGNQKGLYVQYFSNGRIEHEGWYEEGKTEQRWLTYFPDGTLQTDNYFISGEQVGQSYNFAVDGKKYRNVSYRDGVVEDQTFFDSKGKASVKRVEGNREIYEQFFNNKQLKRRDELIAGNFFNRISSNYPDGTTQYDYEMMLNVRHGKYVYYQPNGKILLTGEWEDGERTGTWKRYHFNGTLSSVGTYLDGQQDSLWTYYYEDGKISSVGPWKNDQKHGHFIYYNPEGKGVIEKHFRNDELVAYRSLTGAQPGQWIAFDGNAKIQINYPDGKPALEQEYKNGLLEGLQRKFYSNGTLYEEAIFKDGDYHGEVKVYYANGKLQQRQQYQHDEVHGVHERYNEQGSMISSAQYRFGHDHGKFLLFDKGQKVKEYNFWYGSAE